MEVVDLAWTGSAVLVFLSIAVRVVEEGGTHTRHGNHGHVLPDKAVGDTGDVGIVTPVGLSALQLCGLPGGDVNGRGGRKGREEEGNEDL